MKRIALVLAAVLLVVSLAGCSSDSLEGYREAARKTDGIKMGRTSGEYTTAMDFNTEGMTEEQIKEISYLKNTKGSFNAVYDDIEGKGIFRNYLNLGGLGFDFDLYMNKDEVFIKLPVVGKYLRIDELQTSIDKAQEGNKDGLELVSKDTQAAISEKWLGLLKKEDVFKKKDIILTTPDGEVKTTQYTISLNDEQIKNLASDCMEILSKDEKLKENYENYIKRNVKTLEAVSFEKIMGDLKENLKNYKVENFSYNAYVDIDGYIVNETVELALKIEDSRVTSVKGVDYKLDIKNWDINKKQNFEFPALTEENTLKRDNMYQSLPFMFEDMFNKED